ncbi:MAG TPA: hypothetical protein VFD70_22060 [Anaerolineae bacterium]|nr:hypothetical protein [Anaerolineae bacterium]
MSPREELNEMLAQLNEEQAQLVRTYIESLLRPRADATSNRWSFDFIEHFGEAKVSAQRDKNGMEVQVGEATCDQVTRPALWEHPPLTGAAIISYAVPIPPHLRALKLKFFIGIRDGSQLPNDRYVAFRVIVNGWKLWSAVKNSRGWDEYTVAMPELASDVARIEFQTDGLGDHRWNWAVWGEPKLISDF